MPNVAIITDSTAYLPKEYLQQYDIQVAPLSVIFGDESFRDGVDMSPSEFYNRLQNSPVMPTTSQVTVGAFEEMFEPLCEAGRDILVIPISSGLSGTVETAKQAAKSFPEAKIAVVDSLTTAVELGLLVLATARLAEDGASLDECKNFAEQARTRTGIIFAVDTLEFLHRGGRIGGAKRLMGTMLNIKPILTIAEGRIDALEQIRTRRKSIKRLIELTAEELEGKPQPILGVSHASVPEEARKLLEMASAQLHPVETMFTELSPVIGTHAGPGTLVLAYYYED